MSVQSVIAELSEDGHQKPCSGLNAFVGHVTLTCESVTGSGSVTLLLGSDFTNYLERIRSFQLWSAAKAAGCHAAHPFSGRAVETGPLHRVVSVCSRCSSSEGQMCDLREKQSSRGSIQSVPTQHFKVTLTPLLHNIIISSCFHLSKPLWELQQLPTAPHSFHLWGYKKEAISSPIFPFLPSPSSVSSL